MRNVWLLLALASLLHVLPQTATLGTVALTVCVTALALAFAGTAVTSRPVVLRASTTALVAPPRITRQDAPARAGRPQPRAPGCGR